MAAWDEPARVRSVAWHPAPVVNTYVCEPHVIEVDVAPDNAKVDKQLEAL